MVRRIRPTSQRQAVTRQDVIIVAAVIGSILVLAVTIVLPAWPRPKGARQAVCMSNLKQVGLGLVMYATANKGFVPIASSPGERGWVGIVARETGLL